MGSNLCLRRRRQPVDHRRHCDAPPDHPRQPVTALSVLRPRIRPGGDCRIVACDAGGAGHRAAAAHRAHQQRDPRRRAAESVSQFTREYARIFGLPCAMTRLGKRRRGGGVVCRAGGGMRWGQCFYWPVADMGSASHVGQHESLPFGSKMTSHHISIVDGITFVWLPGQAVRR